MKSPRPFKIDIPVWDTVVHVLFKGPNLAARLKRLNVLNDDLEDALQNDYSGITCRTKDSRAVVIVLEPNDDLFELIGTLGHELFHAVHDIMYGSGVRFRETDANESHAYLFGYLIHKGAEKLIKQIGFDKKSPS